jgi:hypothetical protein
MTSPTFEQTWRVPALGQHVAPGPGHCVFADDAESSSVPAGVRTVFCDGDFRIAAPAPDIERLTVWGRLTGDLARLAGLRELTAEWHESDLNGLPDSVHSLAVHPKSLVSAPALSTLKRLRLFYLCRGVADLHRYPALEWLMFSPSRSVASELRPLEHLARLELRLANASLASLTGVGRKELLRDVSIDGPGLKSLRGIGAWSGLESLTLTQSGIEDLTPLADSGAREVVLEFPTRQPIQGFAALGAMRCLTTLTLEVSSGLADLGFLSAAPELESVTIVDTPLPPEALEALASIETLRRVTLSGTGCPGSRLQELRPDISVSVDGGPGASSAVTISESPGGWVLSGNVAALIGAATNYDAEQRIRRALDPALEDVIEFDTESGQLVAYAADRVSLLAVRDEIDRAIRER